MNLFMKKADRRPDIKVPASIEKQARDMLEPEEQKNVAIVNKPITDKDPKSNVANPVHTLPICPMCRQNKELVWVNPGNLGPNTKICSNCIPRLFEGYGYKEPGYRIIDDQTIKIFSQTTGWERIKTYWVKELFGGVFANALFPVSVYLEHEEIKEASDCGLDHNRFGITWACARLLSIRASVPIPDQEPAGSAVAQS